MQLFAVLLDAGLQRICRPRIPALDHDREARQLSIQRPQAKIGPCAVFHQRNFFAQRFERVRRIFGFSIAVQRFLPLAMALASSAVRL